MICTSISVSVIEFKFSCAPPENRHDSRIVIDFFFIHDEAKLYWMIGFTRKEGNMLCLTEASPIRK